MIRAKSLTSTFHAPSPTHFRTGQQTSAPHASLHIPHAEHATHGQQTSAPHATLQMLHAEQATHRLQTSAPHATLHIPHAEHATHRTPTSEFGIKVSLSLCHVAPIPAVLSRAPDFCLRRRPVAIVQHQHLLNFFLTLCLLLLVVATLPRITDLSDRCDTVAGCVGSGGSLRPPVLRRALGPVLSRHSRARAPDAGP
jgi:hypothetical protein